jgi:predicted deacylase
MKKHYSFLKILTGSDLSKRRIPTMELASEVDGPVLWFTGCMHGDEIGGTVIIHELFKKLQKRLVKGRVMAFPLMNPFGFETSTRTIISEEDLNRSFPGDEKGTLAQRIASKIFNHILESGPSMVVDLHNDWNKSIPYALLDPASMGSIDSRVEALAAMTGLLQIVDTDKIHSSLTHNLIQKGVPALVLEMGESMTVNEKNIEIGLNALWNILRNLDMVADDGPLYQYPLPEKVANRRLEYSCLPLSSTSGIIRFIRKPGEMVVKGQKIAMVYNAFGKQIEIIRALEDGIVIGYSDSALSFPGSAAMAYGNLPE